MGWLASFIKRSESQVLVLGDKEVVDVTDKASIIDVTLSIHESSPSEERFGAALCMLSLPGHVDSTGSVVTIGRRPHPVGREQFRQLLHDAGENGHLQDGFLEIEATVDLESGIVTWEPEDGAGVSLLHLDEVVENVIASLVETNVFGEWFAPVAVVRKTNAIHI